MNKTDTIDSKVVKSMRDKTWITRLRCILPLLPLFCSPPLFAATLHQAIQVSLAPADGSLQVRDEIQLPAGMEPVFLLHQGLNPRSQTPGSKIVPAGRVDGPVPLAAYRIDPIPENRRFTLTYGGRISHDFTRLSESPGRSEQRLTGTISDRGVYLDAATGWYPGFPDTLQRFTLQVELPAGWLPVSQGAGPQQAQGKGIRTVTWTETHPQEEIYLIAAPYRLYRRRAGDIDTEVFLLQADDDLAARYLDATAQYLQLFQRLIGPYPYAKFALVENFWETGYGMPSFTLLGSRVIRLPFILNTSYPHEILHNWWGNSVYVDAESGNWSEGLTSYLADHLIAEQQGKGAEYRRNALQRYADFTGTENDFPLNRFRARHSTASQAVGYDKGLMLFHMLRRQLGDPLFIDGLRRFYRQNRFKHAGFEQLKRAFEAAAQRPLETFFRQWTARTGAPALKLEAVSVQPSGKGYRLTGRLSQTQAAAPFRLQIPLAISCADTPMVTRNLDMRERRIDFSIDLPAAPQRLTVDPWFDLFRQLDSAETPPSLSQLFGAERVTLVLPADAPPELLAGYRALAKQWATGYKSATLRLDSELDALPRDRPVLLLGWENRFLAGFLQGLKDYPITRRGESLTLWERSFDLENHSFAIADRASPDSPTTLWIGARHPASLPGLARKLPHYGKYSVLAFAGDNPDNRLKRQWPLVQSPLQIDLSPAASRQPLPEPPPLIER